MLPLDNLGLKKLKINFEHNTTVITLSAEPYKTIKHMKMKAMKSIFPEPINPRIFYQNRDITSFENEQVGTYFQGKSAVILRLSSNENDISYKPTPPSPLNDSLLQQQQQQQQQSSIASISLINTSDFACQCKTDLITFYCRNCRVFLCQTCRSNIKHKSHLTIHVNVKNLEESIRLYAMIVQTDIETHIQSSQNYYAKFREGSGEIEDSSRQNIIFNKLAMLNDRYREMMHVLRNTAHNINEIPLIINEFNLNSKIVNGEIDNVMTEVYSLYSKAKRKMNYDQFRSYFNLINTKERDWENMTKDVLKYKLSSEINDKVSRMYEKINAAIDELLDEKIPFQLDEKSLMVYNELKMENQSEYGRKRRRENSHQSNANDGNNENEDGNEDSSGRVMENLVVVKKKGKKESAHNQMIKQQINEENGSLNDNDNDNDGSPRNDSEGDGNVDMKKRRRESDGRDYNEVHLGNNNEGGNSNRNSNNISNTISREKKVIPIKSPDKSSAYQDSGAIISPKPKTKTSEKEPIVFDEYKSSRKKKR